jgi:serine/threonine protein kinase
MVQREVQMHSCFVHQHIVQFREVFLTSQYLCLAMEYAPGGDLLSYLNENALKSSNVRRPPVPELPRAHSGQIPQGTLQLCALVSLPHTSHVLLLDK